MSEHAEHGAHDAHAAADHGHGAEAHDAHAAADHGHGAEAHDAHAAPAHGHAPHAAAGAKSPIETAFAKINSTSSQVVQTTSKFGAWINKVLRAGEVKPITNVGLAKTIPYAAGHFIDGTALNISRRAAEVTGPVISGMRAAYRSTIGLVLGLPSNLLTINGLKETFKAPLRIMTSTAMAVKNALMATPRAIHEGLNRGIERTVEQLTTQFKRIPLIGEIVSKGANMVTGITSKTAGAVTNALDWSSSFIDISHNAVAPA